MLNEITYAISWSRVSLSLLWIVSATPAIAICLFIMYVLAAIASLGFGAILLLPLLYLMPLWMSLIAAFLANGYLMRTHGVAYGRYAIFWGTLIASIHAWMFWSIWRNHVLPPSTAVSLMLMYPLVGTLVAFAGLYMMQKSATWLYIYNVMSAALTGGLIYEFMQVV